MKMKYIWDMWDGVGELPENLHCVMLNNGLVTYQEDRVECGLEWDLSLDGSDGDIVSYCIAVPDLTGEEL